VRKALWANTREPSARLDTRTGPEATYPDDDERRKLAMNLCEQLSGG